MGDQQRPKDFEEQIVTLERVLQTLREEENVEVLLETTLNYLEAEFDYQLIWIGLYDRLDHRLFGKGGVAPTGDTTFLKQRFNLNPGDLLEQVVIQLRPVGVPDLREEARAGEWRKAAQQFNIQGTMIFPLRYKDRCYGVALLGSDTWGVSPRTGEKAQMTLIFGGLAAALYQIEVDWQRQQAKRPEVPLFALISHLSRIRTLDHCLEAVVEESHKFITPTRTNIYWFERERRYFWRRASNRQMAPGLGASHRPASGITVQDLGGFYQALANEQIVWIGESHSSLRTELTGRLMQQIRARSLLAAPIVLNNELLGFLAVEGSEPRIWLEDEKNFLRGVAQLVALTAPLFEMEGKIRQAELDRDLTAGLARAIYTDRDWQATLKSVADQVCDRLHSEYFLLLLQGTEVGQFEVVCHYHPRNRRMVATPLQALSVADLHLLEQGEAVGIENWDEDRRLLAWREAFAEVGVRSLLTCSTGIQKHEEAVEQPGNSSLGNTAGEGMSGSPLNSSVEIEGLLAIGHEATRTWNRSERELIEVVSRQVGLILHQWQLVEQVSKSREYHQAIQSAWRIVQQTHQLDQLERRFTQHIAATLGCPLVALVTWSPGRQAGRMVASAVTNPLFALNSDVVIPVHTDALIQKALSRNGVLRENVSQLPATTKRWLRSPALGQILVAVMRTAMEHEPAGVVLVGEMQGHRWPELSVNLVSILASQLAWSRRYLMAQGLLQSQKEELEWLNWYKQRRLEELYRTVGAGVKQLGELSQSAPGVGREQKDTLTTLRYQQLLRQMGNALASTNLLLKQEQWRLHTAQDVIPLASLLRRSLERIDPLIKQSELSIEVHREDYPSLPSGQVLSVRGDGMKLELVLYEVLLTACRRCLAGGKLEIRCKPLDDKFLDLLIMDNGVIEPLLIHELNSGAIADILAPSTLDKPPGQQLVICQRVMRQMGGDFYMDQLENGWVVSRLVLALGSAGS